MTQEEETNRVFIELRAIIDRIDADFERISVLLKRLIPVYPANSTISVDVTDRSQDHLPPKEKAKSAGTCYECGLHFYVGDWIIVQTIGDYTKAMHAEHSK